MSGGRFILKGSKRILVSATNSSVLVPWSQASQKLELYLVRPSVTVSSKSVKPKPRLQIATQSENG